VTARRSFWIVTDVPFDPRSPGARRLARDWVPHLERWEMRVPDGHFYTEGDGSTIPAGQTVDVGAPHGQQLREHGYEFVSVHQMRGSH
jgi:hypothetical protein